MKRAKFVITAECLESLIGFRDGIHVVDVAFVRENNALLLYLGGEGLPETACVAEGLQPSFAAFEDVATSVAKVVMAAGFSLATLSEARAN